MGDSDYFRDFAARAAGVQGRIARDVWPRGAVLTCAACGRREPITTEQAGRYLSSGWPQCCGATMGCEAPSAEDATNG